MVSSAIFTTLLISLYQASFCTAKPSAIRVPELKLPEYCYNKGYCFEKHELYPQDLINSLLLKWNITVKDKQTVNITVKPRTHKIDNKMDDEIDCEKNVDNRQIYEIIDKNNKTRIVVQSNEYLEQIIQVEECANAGRILTPSQHFAEETVLRFNLYCVQNTINYQFLVLNNDWTGFEMSVSKYGIPVVCNCISFDGA